MAERTGIGAPDLSRIDSARSAPTPDQARAILRAFDEARNVGLLAELRAARDHDLAGEHHIETAAAWGEAISIAEQHVHGDAS